MLDTSYPVKIYCPVCNAERIVYFLPVENGEKYTIYPDRFNGCEEEAMVHPECDTCKKAAFEIIKNLHNM